MSNLTSAVQEKYAAVATSSLTNAHAGVQAVAEAFGYSPADLASIPPEANMGLSCGNPLALASLRPGETVVDLGSGGGLDVFLASRKVGPNGRAIGIDMTPAMIARATEAARKGIDGVPFSNVQFLLAPIDRIPLPDASVNCVISNCVINLAPDKPAVFREIARILKPGGRLAASNIALKQTLPPELASDVMAFVGCIAGAIMIDDYRRQLQDAGFLHVEIIDSAKDVNAYAKLENQSACCSPAMDTPATQSPAAATASPPTPASSCCSNSLNVLPTPCCGGTPATPPTTDLHATLKALLTRYDINHYAASVKVFAVKP